MVKAPKKEITVVPWQYVPMGTVQTHFYIRLRIDIMRSLYIRVLSEAGTPAEGAWLRGK
jgi:hypothetical protein